MKTEKLKITEIFLSLQGESNTTGIPTVFVRLTGCPLRCTYCDTAYAFTGGDWMELGDILKKVETYGVSYVTVTGGEPLAQKACLALLTQLCDQGYTVSLETSGAIDASDVDQRVNRVIDVKTPGSKESSKNNPANMDCLKASDSLKFVICDESDYQWSVDFLGKLNIPKGCDVLFSPSHGMLEPAVMADWIVRDRLPVRMQIQLHKYLWGDVAGR